MKAIDCETLKHVCPSAYCAIKEQEFEGHLFDEVYAHLGILFAIQGASLMFFDQQSQRWADVEAKFYGPKWKVKS